jgi:hypothetical protein
LARGIGPILRTFVSNGNFLARGGGAVSPLCTGERSYCAETEEVGCREEGEHAIETEMGGAGTILAVADLNPQSAIPHGLFRNSHIDGQPLVETIRPANRER